MTTNVVVKHNGDSNTGIKISTVDPRNLEHPAIERYVLTAGKEISVLVDSSHIFVLEEVPVVY